MKIALLSVLGVAATGCIDLSATDATWMPIDQLSGDMLPDTGAATLRADPIPGAHLRVVTYNIENGGADPLAIAAAFQADPDLALADVVLVQEAEAFAEEGTTRVSRLAGALGMNWIYAPARPEGDGTLGDAILSRFPMDGFAVMHLPLASRKRQRVAISADLHVGTATFKVVTTQLDTTLNITDRILQMHPIVIDLPDLAFVGGDFNTNPYAWEDGTVPVVGASAVVDTDQAPILDDYMAQQGFANFTAGDGVTEVRYGIHSRLDAVYTRGATVGAGNVNHAVGLSDHQPVWVEIEMPGQ